MSERRIVLERGDGSERALATNVEIADSMLSQATGLMGRAELPEGYALVLEVGEGLFGPSRQVVHMLFVRTPLTVVWVEDETVVQVRTLQPWTGRASARADTLIELAAGEAAGVKPGDTVRLVDEGETTGSGESGETAGPAEDSETAGSAGDGADPTV